MKFKILALILFSFALIGCTENQRARSFGGTMTVDLPAGEKLFDITWKEHELWYCTRPMRDGEKAEIYTFQEKSSYGTFEGTVILVEHELK